MIIHSIADLRGLMGAPIASKVDIHWSGNKLQSEEFTEKGSSCIQRKNDDIFAIGEIRSSRV